MDFYTNSKNEVKTYKGYNALAIDGSVLEIPNIKELREVFKMQKNSSGQREATRARVSGIYDITNEFMVDAIIIDCGQGEKSLAKQNIEKAGKIIDLAKSIIIFDRGYSGIDLIWYLEKLGIKYIFRLQSTNMYKKEKRNMITNDEWVELNVCGDRLRKIENFTEKTKITIEQDFYAQIYVFNLLQDIKHEANKKNPKKTSREEIKIRLQT